MRHVSVQAISTYRVYKLHEIEEENREMIFEGAAVRVRKIYKKVEDLVHQERRKLEEGASQALMGSLVFD